MDAASVAIGEPVNGDCSAGCCAPVCRSPEMKRKSLLLGATGERKASLDNDGLSAAAGTGDLHTTRLVIAGLHNAIHSVRGSSQGGTSTHAPQEPAPP